MIFLIAKQRTAAYLGDSFIENSCEACRYWLCGRYVGHLGKWLARQRVLHKRAGSTRLAPDREALLQVLVDEGTARDRVDVLLVWVAVMSCLSLPHD